MASTLDEEGKSPSENGNCCTRLLIKESPDATGAGMIRMGNGPVLASNFFLAISLLTLAKKQIGCYFDDDTVESECGKVYGFKPSSLLTNIGVVAGVLTALFLPFIGAIVDCTTHRRTVGYISATILLTIQTIQIGTVQSTWFPMIILQSINGFMYFVQTLAAFSYYPEIAREVGVKKMATYLADYTVLTFGTELIYLIVVVGISTALSFDNIRIAQLGQALCVAISGVVYGLGWHKYFTNRPVARALRPGQNLAFSGFTQVFKTFAALWKHYRQSIGYFLLAVMVGQAGANAFTSVAITYFTEVLNFDGGEIGIILIVVLASTLPGSYLGAFVSKRSTPKKSILLNIILFIGANFAGFLLMTGPDDKPIAYAFGSIWGVLLGWFYPTESLIFSTLMPKGQESELSGFYLYCSQILAWLPNLIFTIMNEADVSLNLAGIHLNIYFAIAALFYIAMSPWDICIEASKVNLMKDEESERNDEL